MVTCLGELHIWTLRNQTIIPDVDVGCFTYHDKGETVNNSEQPYYDEKQKYTKCRDVTWNLKNKRPEKTRDTLKESEELILVNKCISCAWKSHRLIQVILSNGTILYYVLNDITADVDKVFIDKSLVGKLSADNATDVIVDSNFLAFSYLEKTRLDYVFLAKIPREGPKKLEKLSVYEPKISQIDLPGPSGRRLERRLSCNINKDLILAWWATTSAEAWPWAPMTSDRERANIVILAVNGPNVQVLCYARTDCDPVYATFSDIQPHKVFTIEQASGKEANIDSCTYEISRATIPIKLQKTSVTSIPLKNGVISYGRNISEDKLLMGCADGTLILYDEQKKSTQLAKAKLTPSMISWHPSGCLVLVASTRAEIQIFDIGLSSLKLQLLAENLSPKSMLEISVYFRSPPSLGFLRCCPYESADTVLDCSFNIMLCFDRGPVTVLNLKLGASCMTTEGMMIQYLVNQYIKHRQIDEAVNLLCALNWDVEGSTCLACLCTILDYLLRNSLDPQKEGQLETVLGSFYAPPQPLAEVTILEYRDTVSRYARRFFHHLLRYSRYDKAFLLAVDIGSRDLFMDIHYLAQDKGELALAEVAKQKADQIEAESIDTGSLEDDVLSGDTSYSTESYEELNMNGNVSPRMQQTETSQNGRGNELNFNYPSVPPPPVPRQRPPPARETPNAIPVQYHEDNPSFRQILQSLNPAHSAGQAGTLSDDESQVFYI